VLLLAACGRDTAPPEAPPRPVRTTVVAATTGTAGATHAGTVQARHQSQLGFQAAGRIVARLVDVGVHVRRGQVLMRLDPAQQQLQLTASSANVDAAANRVVQLRVDVQRTQALLARQFASQAELDQQKLALAEAESQLDAARARRQIDVVQRGYTELVADCDGVVSAVSAEAGQVVSPGQPVVTLAADGEREVLVSVAESRIDELKGARTLQVSLWAKPGKTYRGVLRELAVDADRVGRTYAARIAVPDADAELRLGMTASVHTPDVQGTQAIRLPLTAVLDRDGKPVVWLVDTASSRVSRRGVTLGAAQHDSVAITAGLAGGETVVTHGVHLLVDGQAVRTIDDRPLQPGTQP
jgi:RND family efflux transporter MFP subunit